MKILDITKRALAIREQRDLAMVSKVDARSATFMRTPYVQKQRLENFIKKLPEMVKIENVVSITIIPCEGTGEWVVSLCDVDGNRTSLWTEDAGVRTTLKVRSLTNY